MRTDHFGRLYFAGCQQLAAERHVLPVHHWLLYRPVPWWSSVERLFPVDLCYQVSHSCHRFVGVADPKCSLPVAAVAMIIAFFILRGRTKGANARDLPYLAAANETKRLPLLRGLLRVDWIGAILFMGAGILVLLALNWGSSEQWDQTKVIVSWVVGGIFFVAFIVWEVVLEKFAESPVGNRRSKLLVDPMIPVSLFKSLDVCIVQYATFVTGLNMLVMFYFVAIFSTIVNGLSPDKAGAQLIYFAPGMVCLHFLSLK